MSNVIAERMQKMAGGTGVLAMALGVVILLGYVLGNVVLATFAVGHTMARPNAAVGLLLGGIAVLLLRPDGAGGWRRRAGRASALGMLMIGAATLSEFIFGWTLGIDQLLFQEVVRAIPSPVPGRMSLLTAVSLVLLGAGLLGLDWEPRRGWRPAQWAALTTIALSVVVLLGYTFGEPGFTSFGASVAMSIPVALGLVLLAAGMLLARPECGWMRLVSSERAGGALLRAWLPLAVGTIWLVGWLSIAGSHAGWYNTEVDQVFFATPLIFLFVLLISLAARSLDRVDEERRRKAEEVVQSNRQLEARVEQRTAQLTETISAREREMEERKRAEEDLRKASLYARSLLEASLDPLVTIRKDGKVMDANRAAEEITGVARDKLIGSDFCNYFTEPEKARAGYEQVFATGRVQDYPLSVRHISGRVTEVLYNASVFHNERGEVEGVFAAARDITERKRAEGQVRRAALYTRSLIEASLDPLVTISKTGKIMDVNRATEEATGVGRERLVGSDFSNYFTEPERARQGYEQVFSQGFVQDYPLIMRRPSGQVIEVLYNASQFKNEAGEVEGVFAAARDVTARKRAEREAQRLNRALRALSECNEAVMRASEEVSLLKQVCDIAVEVGGYRMAWVGYAEQDENKTVRLLAQAGAEAGYLDTVNITWADTERGRGPTGTAVRTGKPLVCEDIATCPCMLPWREAALAHGFRSCVGLPLMNEDKTFGVMSIYASDVEAFDAVELHLLEDLASDLSYGILALRARDQVRVLNAELEERVRQRTAELEESNRELESFTYSVSHDLRAPLRHVDGFSKILLEEYGPTLDENGRRHLERVRQGTQFMGRLVDDLLNLSRVGRQPLSVQITGLASLVDEVRQELAAEAEGREVEWRIGPLPFVECDPGLMKQVLANLLSNALKFTRPRAQARIEVGQRPDDGGPVIFVRDNGVGFHMKYADKLFGIFQRLHRQEDFEGTGVGLATVERILHKHGGRVWAEAELDKGATFYFTLGAAEVSAARPAAQEVAA